MSGRSIDEIREALAWKDGAGFEHLRTCGCQFEPGGGSSTECEVLSDVIDELERLRAAPPVSHASWPRCHQCGADLPIREACVGGGGKVKLCPKCDTLKSVDEFYLYPDGIKRYAYCDACRSNNHSNWSKRNPEKNREKATRWWHKTGDARRKAKKREESTA